MSTSRLAVLLFAFMVSTSVGAKTPSPPRKPDAPSAQKRVLAVARDVGTAMMAWLVDHIASVPRTAIAVPASSTVSQQVDWSECPAISLKDLKKQLVPDYIGDIPERDPWGNNYEFCLELVNQSRPSNLIGIRSAGRDGVFQDGIYTSGAFDPSDSDSDIVWVDGFFVRWPQSPPST